MMVVLLGSLVPGVRGVSAEPEVVIADFEGSGFGDWTVAGTAFGDGPVAGGVDGQRKVSGYIGKRFANSYHGGDDATGELTSPPLTIRHDYLTFRIGGGAYEDQTALQLWVNDEIVRRASGPNRKPGGNERLRRGAWDVRPFKGQQAVLRIVDDRTGPWGHLTVDHIAATDRPQPISPQTVQRPIVDRYLLIPIDNDAETVRLSVLVNEEEIRRYSTPLATDPDDVDWYAFFDLQDYQGQTATITADKATDAAMGAIKVDGSIPAAAAGYDEPMRPQLRFSQRVGWINDPNGMVYHDGKWHLYFQHNPVGWNWGNMTWGHAVSPDLVHWEQRPNVLFPNTMAKGACFSGGGSVDHQNTAGWQQGEVPPLVVFLTDTGSGESVAYSNDGGESFTYYQGNPLITHAGRDPKVIWYEYDADDDPINPRAAELGGHWVMVLYDEDKATGRNTSFFTSTDLKDWDLRDRQPGYYECPELFELSVDDHPEESYWITFAADGQYVLGNFDGVRFQPLPQHAAPSGSDDKPNKFRLHHGSFYASQLFTNPPDGRRIQIGWLRGVEFPDHPFNQAFSVPHHLTLRRTGDQVRMYAAPIEELQTLRKDPIEVASRDLSGDEPIVVPVDGDLFEIEATFDLGDADEVGIEMGSSKVTYDVANRSWNTAVSPPTDGRVSVRILIDRSILEFWGNDGAVVKSGRRGDFGPLDKISIFSQGGRAKLLQMKIYPLRSIHR